MTPQRILKPCRNLFCPNLSAKNYCEDCSPGPADYERTRPSSSQRGYGARWKRYVKMFRRANPLCGSCLDKGITKSMTDVDHTIPIIGPNDPNFWNPDNHQALCHECHSQKTNSERGGGSDRCGLTVEETGGQASTSTRDITGGV